MSETINIGISACVLGECVACNGGHARDSYLTETFAKYVKYVPVCPEVACGMNIPRERLRQVDCGGDIRLIATQSGEDWTQRMLTTSERLLAGLVEENLDGYILRRDSASCSLDEGEIHSTSGEAPRLGEGFYTRELMKTFPLLPLELSQRLQNPIIKENFVRRVFVHRRWRTLLSQGATMDNLVEFHAQHQMLSMANDARGFKQLDGLLADRAVFSDEEIIDTYGSMIFKVMAHNSTPHKNANALVQATEIFQEDLDPEEIQELLAMINSYKSGKTPLLVPVTILNHHARQLDKRYLLQQFFLNPDPSELKMLYHV